jgi:hypothetical protein
MNFRILKKPRGYVVEELDIRWSILGLIKIWKPYVKSSGLDCAWHHSSYEHAENNLIKQLQEELRREQLKK